MKEFVPERAITVEEAIEEYLATYCASGTFSQTTSRNRRYYLNHLNQWAKAKGLIKPADYSKNHIVLYLSSLNVTKASKRTILAILAAFFDWCISEGLILDSPLVGVPIPQIYRPEPDCLTNAEMERLYRAVVSRSRESEVDRNLLIVGLMVVMCLRVSEVVNIRLGDLNYTKDDAETGVIRLLRKGGKEVVLPMSTQIQQMMQRWMYVRRLKYKDAKRSEWLFLSRRGNKLSIRQVQTMVQRFLNEAGIAKRKQGPHLLRHSGASYYIAGGMDIRTVQHLLGHENIATTSRYVHLVSGIEAIRKGMETKHIIIPPLRERKDN